jgi:hypothetical protein
MSDMSGEGVLGGDVILWNEAVADVRVYVRGGNFDGPTLRRIASEIAGIGELWNARRRLECEPAGPVAGFGSSPYGDRSWPFEP